ncbi:MULTISPECIES: shikimate dehydrogenase family protein [Rhizobium/Agrobacterium group]|jgi:shikimate dehydrogenase|uniref:shikimate dehydrogenase family protein n=1 Tax=Rhizobium/Agrobacterium group TaxID=227290 RepID=UPI000DD2E1E7|nr:MULTISPECIES: shikimate dehydrogenase [unclassified Rhizobium]
MSTNVVAVSLEAADASEITGRTRVLGILAHPIEHVKAPPGINRIARERRKDAVMVPMNVTPDDLPELVRSLRKLRSFDGAIVTVPHKQAILALCDELTPHARAVGAANILRRESDGRLVGGQLDGVGFVEGLRSQGKDIRGKSVYLVGAGGAASAVAFAMAEARASRITLSNRSTEKIVDLRERLLSMYPDVVVALGTPDASSHDIVINGTTLGMKSDDPLPLDVSTLTSGMTVAEVIMEPEITPLLKAAGNAGCTIHFGKHMLSCQLQLMADFMGL